MSAHSVGGISYLTKSLGRKWLYVELNKFELSQIDLVLKTAPI